MSMSQSPNQCLLLLFVGLMMLVNPCAATFAQKDPLASPLISAEQKAQFRALEQQLSRLEGTEEYLRRQAKRLSERMNALTVADVSDALLQQAEVDVEKWRARREELAYRFAASKTRVKALRRLIEDLKNRLQLLENPVRQATRQAWYAQQLQLDQQALAQRSFDLALEQKRHDIFEIRLAASKRLLEMAELWERRAWTLQRLRLAEISGTVRGRVESTLDLENLGYFDQYLELGRQLERGADNLSDSQRQLLETKRDTALDWSSVKAQEALLDNFAGVLTDTEKLLAAYGESSEILGERYREIRQVQRELEILSDELASRIAVFEKQHDLIQQRLNAAANDRDVVGAEAVVVSELLAALQRNQKSVEQQRSRAENIAPRLRARYDEVYREELFERRSLPLGTEQRAALARDLTRAPELLLYQLQLSVTSLVKTIGRFGPNDWIVFIAWTSGLLLALAALRYGLQRLDNAVRQDMSTPVIARLVELLLGLLRMNLLVIGLVLVLTALTWMLIVAPPSEEIVVTLVSCVVGAKLAVNLAWLLLARPDLPVARRHPRLYRLLAIAFWSGGLLIALTTVGHFALLSEIVLDLLDRLFTLYLLLTVIPVLWIRWVLIQRLMSYYGKRPWVSLVRLTSLIIPLFLLGIGLSGSLGYLNLAWAGMHYLLIFGALLLGWTLSQQLLNDLTAWLKHRALERSRQEWSTTRRIADALHRVLSLGLFLAAIFLLIRFYSLEEAFANAWKVLMTAVVIITALYEMLFLWAIHVSENSEGTVIGNLVGRARKPLGVILPIAAAQITLPRLTLPEDINALGSHVLTLMQISAIVWLFLRLISLLDQVAEQRYRRIDVKEDLVARRARTQLRVLRQSLHVTFILIGIGAILMTFPGVRQLGAGLLASAGAAGLVIGIAARPLFENLIAGIQIALTQPIRLDDVVIVEGEWGTIEEINATYVVVQIWDDRRLVVPLKYFNEKPFQHWSREGTELLGSVFLNVDYSFPVEEGRKALKRILDKTDLWDGRAWVLQVTESKEFGMELRALATACDAPTAWDLRCYVREKLIEFVQQNYPSSLPQRRTRYLSDAGEQEAEEPAAPSFVLQRSEPGLG